MQYAGKRSKMRLYEFEGADLFRREGISVPEFALATSPEEAREQAGKIGLPVAVKAQVLTGGRWLAGGVHIAESLDDVEQTARRVLSTSLRSLRVERVMVAKKMESLREYYLSVGVDDYRGAPVAILSTEGGVDINETAKKQPETVVTHPLSIARGLGVHEARDVCREAGLIGAEEAAVAEVLVRLYGVFRKCDALIAEINPLVKTPEGDFVALDSKVEIDDSSVFRHPELNIKADSRVANPLEKKGREIGVTYVELDGDIGIIASGAGLGMASMDIISQHMKPANFLETGGAITADLLYNVMGLVLEKKGVKALFINIYGGINPIHEGAKGVVRYLKEHDVRIPIVAKALGNYQEETWEILKQGGIHIVDGVSTEQGVEMIAHLLGREA